MMRVELVYFTGCPNVAPVRELLRRCLTQLGLHNEIVDVKTDAPTVPETYRVFGSPTVLIDGVDVLGKPAGCADACRLQLPTENELLAALRVRK
jgi:hypothetical protein